MFLLRGAYIGACIGAMGYAGYYTYMVEEKRKLREEKKRIASSRAQVGSIDDRTGDMLKSGDLIIFERDCSILHCKFILLNAILIISSEIVSVEVPLAYHCMMTKLLLWNSIDHVGIIVKDSKSQKPMVLEAVPWIGRIMTFICFTDLFIISQF